MRQPLASAVLDFCATTDFCKPRPVVATPLADSPGALEEVVVDAEKIGLELANAGHVPDELIEASILAESKVLQDVTCLHICQHLGLS